MSKTRVFGHGHWMSAFPLVEGLPALDQVTLPRDKSRQHAAQDSQNRISQAVARCKQLARDSKKQLPSRSSLAADVYQSLPPRAVMDELVQVYFDSFESCYRILHASSFRTECAKFMDTPETADSPSIVKLLLVISVAATLHGSTEIRTGLLGKVRAWIHICQTWLSAPFEKARLTLDGVQIHCLLLLARQVHRIGADLVWISAGSLERMTIQMGMHQDPDHLGGMSILQKEMRRRLWYTIMELNVQAALDSGVPSMISADDFNTRLPSNMNDEELDDTSQRGCAEHPPSTLTQTSFQRLLGASLTLRLEAIRATNSLREEHSYEDVLHIGSKLEVACREASMFIDQHAESHLPSQFAYNFSDHCLRRFLLCIHYPYAVQARHNPLYCYSLKVCLEVSLDLTSLLEGNGYHRLLLHGGGMFRDIITRGAVVVFAELIWQLEASCSASVRRRHQYRIETLLASARKILTYAQDRLRCGETNVKGYLFTSMAMAQADAMLNDSSIRDATVNAAINCLAACQHILESVAANSSTNDATNACSGQRATGDTPLLPTFTDADFDFLNDENGLFNVADTTWLHQWADHGWLWE